jgi:hypothetical protein
VSFGGHFGDCSDYHGVVVGVGIDRPQLMGAWLTRAAKGGIWAPAGLSEVGGSLYFSTGNTEGARSWGDGEGVFRAGPDLTHSTDPRDFFAPSDWKQLDAYDLDLSGVTPQESPHLSDRSKNVGEERLLLQHLGEAMHQWAQPVITHCGQ